MAPRTFKANSIKEAVSQVKAQLGADAMILSTRKVARGPQNPYGKDLFEVTASADDDMAGLLKTAPESVREPRASWTGDPSIAELPSRRSLQAELAEIKELLLLSSRAGGIAQFLGLHPICLSLYTKLLSSGLSERRVWAYMNAGGAFDPKKRTDPETVTRDVIKALSESIEVVDPFLHHSGGCRVAAFVGPTGVGKTTTLAKLCAELSLKQKKSVGIISIDNYRIGAVEQLKTYASIMGLPCLSAFTRDDLGKALHKMNGRDVILIDTAGQSHRDLARLQELQKLIGEGFSIDTHLVLSAVMKPEDMNAAAANFSVLKPASYVFTKVDETRTRGAMIDQLLDLPLPVSFVTNGQRVPEDIIAATRQKVLKLALEGVRA